MEEFYEVVDEFVIRNMPSGKRNYICNVGELIYIGWDKTSEEMIAHGDMANVARIIQLVEDVATHSSSDTILYRDYEILYVEATPDNVQKLNLALLDANNVPSLISVCIRYDDLIETPSMTL